ncbi:MAG: type I-C CRISPR-associated endonuclease Cas1 [Verrucomicrobia bacterium]|nr:type I-C CRISPR-associated endonuclease Cas1 [Kiritimatiellia bacterium]MCP5488576.1 type I-C CRISPR-associated endonuclease Cas1 [Verrucomicrobiota bacterium]
MKKFLNTLFVTTQGAYLNKEGQSVVVSVEREVKLRVPVHTLGGIVCFGNVLCSPFLLGHCAENGVAVSMLTERGRFLARIHGPVSGNVRLRREQYRRADDLVTASGIAQTIVTAKVANARAVLQRAVRDHGEKEQAEFLVPAVTRLGRILSEVEQCTTLDQVRGSEGDAGREYFGVFDHLITAQKDAFFLRDRNRRPPLDNVNALLSFTYTLLAHDCVGALESVGLDPQVGFLHRDRSGRPSLALDLMEEFRPYFADRLVLSLINLKQVQRKGFKQSESGAVEMDDETRKTLLVAYQKRKQEEIRHPYLGEAMPVGLLFYAQALLLARHVRGDIDGYPPFIWK